MADFISRWRAALSKTSKTAFGRLAGLLGATEINADTWAQLEAILLQADLGMDTTREVIDSVKERARSEGLRRADELWSTLGSELRSRLETAAPPGLASRPSVILLVGVNGSGKTTTLAKLAHYYRAQNKTVLLGAADTFRAAATDQLQVWADRLGVEVVAGAAESDPGAVAHDAVKAGVARGADLVLIDTAGRLHTRSNLMEELKKVRRVVAKALEGAPHGVWLVLDATTGQNALLQARAFRDAVGVTGVILAKLDTSARGGMAFAIRKQLGLPILFAGLGEALQDLQAFDPDAFVSGVLSPPGPRPGIILND